MGRITSKAQLLEEIEVERAKLEALLAEIPADRKVGEEVAEGWSVKDFLAHRTQWGQMMLGWYATARDGGTPAVPHERFKWNQLPALNAEIVQRWRDVPLADVEAQFAEVHDELRRVIEQMTDEELLTKKHYDFTGSSDLASYVNSATAAHYRSAHKHLRRWWRSLA